MEIETFAVEQWMNEYETRATCNIAETCVDSLTLGELLALDGSDVGEFFARVAQRRLTYGDIEGSPAFRELVGRLYGSKPSILLMNGAIGANFLVFFSLIQPGDRVIAVHPTYQQLYAVPRAMGADVKLLRLRAERNFLPDLDELRALAAGPTKMIVLNNPNNPSGALMGRGMLEEIVDIARQAGAYVLCDEVYRDLLQEGEPPAPSIVDLYDRGIATCSMSKVFSLAGLRLGWIAAAPPIVDECMRHRDYTTISCSMIDDLLAVHALRNYDRVMERSLGIVRGNLAVLDAWVQAQPRVSYVRPRGGTTALLRCDVPVTSRDLCVGLLESSETLLTPGSCFDMEGSVRIGYACDPQVLRSGLANLGAHIGSLA